MHTFEGVRQLEDCALLGPPGWRMRTTIACRTVVVERARRLGGAGGARANGGGVGAGYWLPVVEGCVARGAAYTAARWWSLSRRTPRKERRARARNGRSGLGPAGARKPNER